MFGFSEPLLSIAPQLLTLNIIISLTIYYLLDIISGHPFYTYSTGTCTSEPIPINFNSTYDYLFSHIRDNLLASIMPTFRREMNIDVLHQMLFYY